jgi:hypothetical protein
MPANCVQTETVTISKKEFQMAWRMNLVWYMA